MNVQHGNTTYNVIICVFFFFFLFLVSFVKCMGVHGACHLATTPLAHLHVFVTNKHHPSTQKIRLPKGLISFYYFVYPLTCFSSVRIIF